MKLFPILGLAVIFILSGCKNEEEKTTLRGETSRKLTEADLEKVVDFAKKYAEDAKAGDAGEIAHAYNARGFFLRALDGIEFPPAKFEEFIQEAMSGISRRPGGIGWGTLNQDLTFVKLLDFEGMKMPLFRLSADGGFGYMIIMALPDNSGEIKAYDTYMLNNSDWSSQTTRRLILPGIKNLLGSKFARAFKRKDDEDFLNHLETVQAFSSASQTGDLPAVQNAYRALPPSLQKERYFWSLYLSSLNEDVEAHLRESKKFEAAFPDDAGAALMLLDADITREDWEGAHRKLNTIREFVDGDHYMDFFDSLIYILADDYEPGLEFANKSIAAAPENEDYWWNAFTCLTQLENHQELVKRLEGYEKQFGVRLTQDDFAEGFLDKFVTSAAGKAYFSN